MWGVGCRDNLRKPMRESKIQSYRDLRVWQEAVNLAELCYRFTKTFPKEELYGMTTQIRARVRVDSGKYCRGIWT